MDFSQAMTDFRVMFPDMEAEVIEAVLRANNGAVDATIDHLLAMSADNEAMARPPEQPMPEGNKAEASAKSEMPPSYNQAMDRVDSGDGSGDLINLGPPSILQSAASGKSEPPTFKDATASGASPPLVDLLSDLDLNSMGAAAAAQPQQQSKQQLAYSHPQRQEHETKNEQARVPRSEHEPATSSSSPHSMVPTQAQLQEIYEENLRQRTREDGAGPSVAGGGGGNPRDLQFLEDERIALMLQNEEFMAELRRDHEFMSALENEAEVRSSWPQAADQPTETARKAPMDEAAFREKLKNMGKTSKRKFAQMASMFSARGRGGGKGAKLLGHAPAPSKDNLLLDAEPLVNDDDSDDERTKQATKTPTKGKYTSFSWLSKGLAYKQLI